MGGQTNLWTGLTDGETRQMGLKTNDKMTDW